MALFLISGQSPFMRLGGPLYGEIDSPEEWVAAARKENYSALNAPVGFNPDTVSISDSITAAFAEAAAKANLVIAEVGAWSNPIDPDSTKAAEAIAGCQRNLDLADRLGAKCCVNITGSRNPAQWDGPHPTNFSRETFDLIVESTRKIVDAVNPSRTFYCLETMPWIFPSSADQYLDLLKAIDRSRVAVHLDPVNMINCPERAYDTGSFIRDCFKKLGAHIKSCHAKDVVLHSKLTLHLDECQPGRGILDYKAFLTALSKLHPDTPLMLEHLPREDYPAAATYIRQVAEANNLKFI